MTAINHYIPNSEISTFINNIQNPRDFLDDIRTNYYANALIGTPDMDGKDMSTPQGQGQLKSALNVNIIPTSTKLTEKILYVPLDVFRQITDNVQNIRSIMRSSNPSSGVTIMPIFSDRNLVMYRTKDDNHSRLVNEVGEAQESLGKEFDIPKDTTFGGMIVPYEKVGESQSTVTIEGYSKPHREDENGDFQKVISKNIGTVDGLIRKSGPSVSTLKGEFRFGPAEKFHYIFPQN